MANSNYHIPVLLDAVVDGLNIDPQGTYVDATFGGGGHSRAILEKLDQGRLFGFDQDDDAKANCPEDERFTFVKANFRFLKNYLKLHRAIPVQGILADLGVSSHQFDTAARGFSLRFDGPLDMRMDTAARKTAADILFEYSAEDLLRVFREFGELRQAGRIVSAVMKQRDVGRMSTIAEFRALLKPFVPGHKEHQFLAKVFQALRIEVNGEMQVLEDLLTQCAEVIAPGGRLVVISYHSLEDRMVKNFMKKGKFRGEVEKDFFGNPIKPFKTVHSKAIMPEEEEIESNSRARSARLRIAEKLA